MNIDRRLVQVSLLALVVYGLYLIFGPEQVALPLPTYAKDEAVATVQKEVNQLQLPAITAENLYYTDVVANSSIGRFMDKNELSEADFALLEEEVSLFSYEVASLYNGYTYDMSKGRITRAENIYLETDADLFVAEYFGQQYSLKGSGDIIDILDERLLKKTYVAATSFPDIINVVDIYMDDDAITLFEQYAVALGFPKEEESLMKIIASLFILLFLATLALFVTTHLIVKLVKKEIEAFWEPLGLTLVAAIGWLFVNKSLGVNILGFGLIEPLIMMYLTLVTLLIRWKRSEQSLTERLGKLQPSVVHGLLLTVISLLLAEGFFYIASYFDTWVSPVSMYNVLIELDIWYIPIFTLFIGLSAAITEEAIFRHYMIPLFERLGVFFALVMTSFLWGIMHVGYDMYPWFIYVLEFVLITGPFFFFVYKRYGFASAMFMHYFYNAWVTTLFLFTVDLRVALVSLVVMFSPFVLFFIRNNKRDIKDEVLTY